MDETSEKILKDNSDSTEFDIEKVAVDESNNENETEQNNTTFLQDFGDVLPQDQTNINEDVIISDHGECNESIENLNFTPDTGYSQQGTEKESLIKSDNEDDMEIVVKFDDNSLPIEVSQDDRNNALVLSPHRLKM